MAKPDDAAVTTDITVEETDTATVEGATIKETVVETTIETAQGEVAPPATADEPVAPQESG